MYRNLKINDFRLFKNVNLQMGKYVTVLAGRNSTGKSTILGILGNSAELKKKDGTTYSGKRFQAEFGEIFHGSKKFDPSGSDRIQIDITDNDGNVIDYRKFRTAWQNQDGKDRFRVIPLKVEEGKKTEAKMSIPVLYLGLSRLFPIGEADEEEINTYKIRFISQDQKEWFIRKYQEILSINDDIDEISNFTIGETEKKRGVGVETKKYDYLTNSSGQDNLGQILMAILSYKKLKQERAQKWNGGLLLIDEVDATLHPAAQKRLMDLLISEARKIDIQVVVTTHSSDLLKYICTKTTYNNDNENNNVELYYFTNANRRLEVKRNIDYSTIESDLMVQSMVQSANKVKVYSEDDENRWFLKKLIMNYVSYVEILDVKIGCSQLLSLYCADLTYFGNVLIVLDGDVKDNDLKVIPDNVRAKINNIIRLPGAVRPEEVFYEYILSLDSEHPYWESAGRVAMSWQYFKDNGPLSSRYSQHTERERYKEWFKEHMGVFDSTKLFDFWAKDNPEIVEKFVQEFIKSYNSVASRIFAVKIAD